MSDNQEEYDFVIIGSGLGGLESAYILADEGYKVIVLEKNHQIGGNLQVFSRDKSIFDTGVHYIGNLDEGECLHQFFDYFGLLDLKWKRLDDDCFDLIRFPDGKEYKLAQGYDLYKKTLIDDFPQEAEAIENYCKSIQQICENFPMYKVNTTEVYDFFSGELSTKAFQNAAEFVESLTKNKRLQAVLLGNNGLYAGVKEKTPIYVHALITDSFINGAYRLQDGGSQIAISLTKSIRNLGGKVLKRKKVVSANYDENKNITEVVLENGETIKGKNYISNAHPAVTIDIFGEDRFLKPYVKRIKNLENTISSFNLYISLKEDTFEYLNYNIYLQQDDPWESVRGNKEGWGQNLYICTPSVTKSEKYTDSLIVMAYMTYEEVKQWEHTFNTVGEPSKREEAYYKFKKEKEDIILKKVEEVFPDIRTKIKSVHSSSPLTARDYIGDKQGSLYGILKDSNSPAKTLINPSTKIPNLYLTGQNLILHGIVGVTIGAFVTCFHFIDKQKLMQKVLAKKSKLHI